MTAEDLLSVRYWTEPDIGRLRRDVLQEVLSRTAPTCRVSTGPLDSYLDTNDGAWDLVVAGLTGDDLYLLAKVASYAHRCGVRSIYGHLERVRGVRIGPSVVPGESACWNCCRLRRLANTDMPKPAHDIDSTLISKPAPARARSFLAPMASQTGNLRQWRP